MEFSHDLINDLRYAATDIEQQDFNHTRKLLLKAAGDLEALHIRAASHSREIGALLTERDETQKRHNAIVDTLSRALNYLTRNA